METIALNMPLIIQNQRFNILKINQSNRSSIQINAINGLESIPLTLPISFKQSNTNKVILNDAMFTVYEYDQIVETLRMYSLISTYDSPFWHQDHPYPVFQTGARAVMALNE